MWKYVDETSRNVFGPITDVQLPLIKFFGDVWFCVVIGSGCVTLPARFGCCLRLNVQNADSWLFLLT